MRAVVASLVAGLGLLAVWLARPRGLARDAAAARPRARAELRDLSPGAWRRVVGAMWRLKRRGRYDDRRAPRSPSPRRPAKRARARARTRARTFPLSFFLCARFLCVVRYDAFLARHRDDVLRLRCANESLHEGARARARARRPRGGLRAPSGMQLTKPARRPLFLALARAPRRALRSVPPPAAARVRRGALGAGRRRPEGARAAVLGLPRRPAPRRPRRGRPRGREPTRRERPHISRTRPCPRRAPRRARRGWLCAPCH